MCKGTHGSLEFGAETDRGHVHRQEKYLAYEGKISITHLGEDLGFTLKKSDLKGNSLEKLLNTMLMARLILN